MLKRTHTETCQKLNSDWGWGDSLDRKDTKFSLKR